MGSSIGYFLPILIAFCVGIALFLGYLDKMLKPKGSYEKWLEEELKINPDYINWLKVTHRGKDYKLGLKILRKIKEAEKIEETMKMMIDKVIGEMKEKK